MNRILIAGGISYDKMVYERNDGSEDIFEIPGGCGGNIAYFLAVLGVRVAIRTAVGIDFVGSEYELELQQLGIDLRHLEVVNNVQTRRVTYRKRCNALDVDRERVDPYVHPEGMRLKSEALDFNDYDLVIISSDSPVFIMQSVVDLNNANRNYIFDPGRCVFRMTKLDLETAINSAFSLFVNKAELEHLISIGFTLDDLLNSLSYILVTEGSEGARIYIRNLDPICVPIESKINVVDTAGCGDSFRGGFISRLFLDPNVDFIKALKRGNLVGVKVASVRGCRIDKDTITKAISFES